MGTVSTNSSDDGQYLWFVILFMKKVYIMVIIYDI